jgi:hypothetical protein
VGGDDRMRRIRFVRCFAEEGCVKLQTLVIAADTE